MGTREDYGTDAERIPYVGLTTLVYPVLISYQVNVTKSVGCPSSGIEATTCLRNLTIRKPFLSVALFLKTN